MRTTATINWTVSSCKSYSVNKALGKITAKTYKEGDDPATAETFVYGTKIYVTGVHAKTGISFNDFVTVGMEQAVDAVSFRGFLNKNKKTETPTDTLPADFAKDTYVLLYQTLDQNGNVYETAGDNLKPNTDANGDGKNDSARINVICDNIFLVAMDFKDDSIYSIDGEEYASVTIQPGQYVDRGGEVNITIISCTTGKSTVKNFVIDAGGLLKSLTLKEPSKVVADGDKNVEIPYDALDTAGNKVTNYETIARSTNTLSLNASDGELVVREKNDGTAGIYWSDSMSATNFADPSASDDVDRPISLTTVVVGGESQTMMLSVSDMRRPSAIQQIDLNDDANDTIVAGNTATLSSYNAAWPDPITDYGWGNFYYLDQYGELLRGSSYAGDDWSRNIAETFFTQAATGFDDYIYGIKVDMNSKSSELMGVANVSGATSAAFVYKAGDQRITYSPSLSVAKKDNAVVKYSIVRIPDNATAATKADVDNWDDVSKVKVVTYTVVPLKDVKNFAVNDVAKLQAITNYKDDPNGLKIAEDAGVAAGGNTNEAYKANPASDLAINGVKPYGDVNKPDTNVFKVVGTVDGKTVEIPSVYYRGATASGSAFTVSGNVISNIKKAEITWSDLYNINDSMKTRKDAVKELKLDIGVVSGGAVSFDVKTATIKKSVTISDAAPAPAEIQFYNPADYSTTPDSNPDFTSFGTPVVRVFDQYTHLMDPTKSDEKYSYDITVSKVKESEGALTRKPESFVINKNGSEETTINGAEIGDTFTYTATVVGTNLSTSVDMTVGADKKACISSKNFSGATLGLVDTTVDALGNPTTATCDCKSADEHLRTEFLGYDR